MRRAVGLVLLLLGASCSASSVRPFCAVAAGKGAACVASLKQGPTVILRLRGSDGTDAPAATEQAAARLNRLAFAGLRAEDIKVTVDRPGGGTRGRRRPAGDALLVVHGVTVVRLTAGQAALSGSTPAELVAVWAGRLRALFHDPYLFVMSDVVALPWGETRTVAIGGRFSAPVQASSRSPEVVAATLDPGRRAVRLRALDTGDVTVRLRAGSAEAALEVVARKWAARIAPTARLAVSGPPEGNTDPWLLRAMRVAARAAVVEQPGARVTLEEVQLTRTRASVLAAASGRELLSLHRRIRVELTSAQEITAPPARAVLSNDPERVPGPQPLARARLEPGQVTHFLWHHLACGPGKLQVAVRLCNSGRTPAAVLVTGADSGPSKDEVYVGNEAMARFVGLTCSRRGEVFALPPRRQCELSRLGMSPGEVVSGVARMTLLSGQGVFVEVEAVAPGSCRDDLEPVPAALTPASPTRCLELPGYKALGTRQTVGEGWKFLSIGRTPEGDPRAARLRGDYGVLHDARITFDNPRGQRARLEVALRSGGGAARAVVVVEGQLRTTRLLREGDEEVIYECHTQAATTTANLRLIPQSGSNYPLTIIVRSFVK